MVNSALRTIGRSLLDYLAPQCCIYCDQPSYRSEAICEVCQDALSINDRGCPQCALPQTGGALCPSCLARAPTLTTVTAAYEYDPALAYLMHRWKYLGEQRLALTAAKIMLNAPISFKSVDYLLATPLHWQRQLRRGFNQSEDLLRALSHLEPSAVSYLKQTPRLTRSLASKAQAKATRRERLANLQGAFSVKGDVKGHSVGIVDDVCTTCATGNTMASALLSAGASEVHLYCLARTPSR